jgi:hydroxymethylpyrimidine/phosphomethylpyrimidine kinase
LIPHLIEKSRFDEVRNEVRDQDALEETVSFVRRLVEPALLPGPPMPYPPAMNKAQRRPVALTIAGSDSGGGAGIQADLKTFASVGVHGTSVITCITAQNPGGVRAIQPCRADVVRAQLAAIYDGLRPAAVKTGMLYSKPILGVVVDWLRTHPGAPVVVDPVMLATSGARLIQSATLRTFRMELLPRAALVTPNLDETAVLTGIKKPRSVEEMRTAARAIYERYGCAVLVKGGHLRGWKQAIDVFREGKTELLLEAPFVRGISTHGTGCTYSAAITARLARGLSLQRSVEWAKTDVTYAVANSYRIGQFEALQQSWGHSVLLKSGHLEYSLGS